MILYALGAWGPAYVTRENFENMMQFGGFGVYLIRLCLENSLIINIFWIKK